jgi:hypothetical protein
MCSFGCAFPCSALCCCYKQLENDSRFFIGRQLVNSTIVNALGSANDDLSIIYSIEISDQAASLLRRNNSTFREADMTPGPPLLLPWYNIPAVSSSCTNDYECNTQLGGPGRCDTPSMSCICIDGSWGPQCTIPPTIENFTFSTIVTQFST